MESSQHSDVRFCPGQGKIFIYLCFTSKRYFKGCKAEAEMYLCADMPLRPLLISGNRGLVCVDTFWIFFALFTAKESQMVFSDMCRIPRCHPWAMTRRAATATKAKAPTKGFGSGLASPSGLNLFDLNFCSSPTLIEWFGESSQVFCV